MDVYGVTVLLKAENEANKIIEQALEDKSNQIKKARLEAESEMEEFKLQQEKFYQEEIQKRFGNTQEDEELKRKTEEDIKKIHQAYTERKDDVVELLLERVMNVNLEVPNVVKRSLVAQK